MICLVFFDVAASGATVLLVCQFHLYPFPLSLQNRMVNGQDYPKISVKTSLSLSLAHHIEPAIESPGSA